MFLFSLYSKMQQQHQQQISSQMHSTHTHNMGHIFPSAPFIDVPSHSGGTNNNNNNNNSPIPTPPPPSHVRTNDLFSTGPGYSLTGTNPMFQTQTTQTHRIIIDTVPMDYSAITSVQDHRTAVNIHERIVSLGNTTPLFIEKNIIDTGDVYNISFRWGDNSDWWHFDIKTLNKYVLSIPGVVNVRVSYRCITVTIKKTSDPNEGQQGVVGFATTSDDNFNKQLRRPLDLIDRGVSADLYVPEDEQDQEIIDHIVETDPSLPPIQKGLLFTLMKAYNKEMAQSKSLEKSERKSSKRGKQLYKKGIQKRSRSVKNDIQRRSRVK